MLTKRTIRIFLSLLLSTMILSACNDSSSERSPDEIWPDSEDKGAERPHGHERDEEAESVKSDEQERIDEELRQDGIIEPEEKVSDWPTLSSTQRTEVVTNAISYETERQKRQQTPIQVIGNTQDFVQALEERYEQITRTEGEEKKRLLYTRISGQLAVVGYEKQLLRHVN